jgi:hypothetical protein
MCMSRRRLDNCLDSCRRGVKRVQRSGRQS